MNERIELNLQTAENLQQRIQSLAGLLNSTAQSLQQGDPVELQHLVDEINSVQDRTQQLSRQLQDHPLLSDNERYANKTGEIVQACHAISERQEALDLLKRIQLVKSFDASDQGAFREFHEQVAGMINRLTSGSSDERRQIVPAIQAERSAFRAVFELVSRPEELSDERWMENQQLIADAFGQHVAMAILRGRAR